MAELLRANVLANFAYFRRSRLLIAFALVFLLLTGLTSLPTSFVNSGVQDFNSLQDIYSTMNEFLLFLAAGLGLFVVSSHLRSRSLFIKNKTQDTQFNSMPRPTRRNHEQRDSGKSC